MYWQEKHSEEPTPTARRMIDVVYGIDCRTLPVDHAWALSQAVIALSYYTLETNPGLVLEARRWLAAVLED